MGLFYAESTAHFHILPPPDHTQAAPHEQAEYSSSGVRLLGEVEHESMAKLEREEYFYKIERYHFFVLPVLMKCLLIFSVGGAIIILTNFL